MSWTTENRRTQVLERRPEPYLTEDLKLDLAKRYFPRYPNKRAVLLPSLHAVQHEHGWIPLQAMEEIAEFLGIAPAEVLDTASFYEEYWLKPKGQYLISVCRSLSCEICALGALTDRLRETLGIELGETSDDGRFTLIELECLGSCGTAPVALVNEVLHENLTVEGIDQLIAKLPADARDYHDPSIDWEDGHGHAHNGDRPPLPAPGTPARTVRDAHDTRN